MDLKLCRKCKKEKPATKDYFSKDSKSKDGFYGLCKDCHKKYWEEHHEQKLINGKKYYDVHKQELSEKRRAYRIAHLDEVRIKSREYNKTYYLKHKETVNRRVTEWNRNNSEKINARARERRRNNPKKFLDATNKWAKKHPDKMREYWRKHWVKRHKAEGHHTIKDEKNIFKKQHEKCLYCDSYLTTNFHIDHFIPLSKNGTNNKENIVCACPSCNESKRNIMPWDWSGWNGAYPVLWSGEVNVCIGGA